MACLGDETIAAYVDGALELDAVLQIDHHIDGCVTCRTQLSAVAAGSLPAPDIAIGDRVEPERMIGRYVLEEVIGRGGMGIVVRARDPELERAIAIKLVDPVVGQRAHLHSEARAMAKLRHPNVVAVYDAGAVGDRLFVAMELVDGETLARHLARDRTSALALCIAAGRGLCAAHAAGLVHGDVKPDNILVDRDGRAMIGDFGLTRSIVGDPAHEGLIGTPAYMAPELLRRQPATPATDQFALAVTIHEAITGSRPWRATSLDDLLRAVVDERPTRPAAMSREVWRVVARGLDPEPTARFPALADFVDALDAAHRPRHRARWIAGAAALATAGITAWLAFARAGTTCVDPIDRTAALAISCGPSPGAPCTALAGALATRAATWRTTHVGVCRATRDGDQSTELLDRRMRCLDQRLLDHASLVGRLATPPSDPDAFAALAALAHLESPSSCATFDHATAAVPTAQATAIALAQTWVATANADYALGHYQAGLAALAPHLPAIRALAYPPLTLAAAKTLGELQMESSDLDGAEASFDLALHAAAEAADDRATATLLFDRAHLLGEARQQWARGAELLRAADAAVVRAGSPPGLVTTLLLERGLMAEDTGDFEGARAKYTRAVELRRTFAGPVDVAIALQRLCAADGHVGQLADARTHCDEALQLLRGALGNDHPIVAEALNNYGVAIAISGDHVGARKEWEAALAILERGLGDDPALAAVLLDLEDVSRGLGDVAAADRYLARALKLSANAASSPTNIDVQIRIANRLRTGGKSAEAIAMLEQLARRAEATLGATHSTTAHVYEDLGATYYDAERYADARAAWEKEMVATTALFGERHPATLGAVGRTGQAMMMMHDAKAARPLFERALLALEATVPADSPFLANAYTNLADCLTALGEAPAAIEPATKALAIREQRGDDPLQTSEARFVLVQALWKARRDPAAVAMARKARDEMRAIGPRATTLPDVERWLAGAR